MIRGLCICLIALLGGGLAAGCGSSSKSASSSQTVAPATSATGTTSSPSNSSGATGGPSLQQAVAACRQIVRTELALASSVKAKVEAICSKAESGDVEGARKAADEVCTQVIQASPVLTGAAKERALAACKVQAAGK